MQIIRSNAARSPTFDCRLLVACDFSGDDGGERREEMFARVREHTSDNEQREATDHDDANEDGARLHARRRVGKTLRR